ncbi:MAG: hypothetical protein EA421_01035 [Gemmatimonadales bacterium]|nr:MAG: hypothetical protein EA421_01035 [Gemmatimonadales bacterium]
MLFIRLPTRRGNNQDLDFFHDSEHRVREAFEADRSLPEAGGFRLHDVDLAINKLLVLAGRDEARDYVDFLEAHERILPLGALIWAAAGKDAGLSPHAILELLKRRGRPRAIGTRPAPPGRIRPPNEADEVGSGVGPVLVHRRAPDAGGGDCGRTGGLARPGPLPVTRWLHPRGALSFHTHPA